MDKPELKLLLLQYNPVWEQKEVNRQKILTELESVTAEFDVVILPEMTLTGFTMSADAMAEDEEGTTFSFYSMLAKKYGAHIIGGMIKKESGKYFNCLLHFDRHGILISEYNKIHLFGMAEETAHYQPGDKPVITNIDGWETGLTICYDLRFPELYRIYSKSGVQLIINIANWPVTRIAHWDALLPARAIENLSFIAACNRTGADPLVSYSGSSQVLSPMGIKLANEYPDSKTIQLYTINREDVPAIRTKLPFLKDMKII